MLAADIKVFDTQASVTEPSERLEFALAVFHDLVDGVELAEL